MTRGRPFPQASPVLALALCAVGACGGATEQSGGGAEDAGVDATDMGNINAEFILPSGSASTASYTLTGPNGYSNGSMLAFQGAEEVGFLIYEVPEGTGYTLAFTAADDDAGESCSATTTLDVKPLQTTMVTLRATCSGGPYVPTGYGSIEAWVAPPQGVVLASANYSLIGPGGIESQGTLAPMNTSGIRFELTRVPAANDQVLTLTGSTTSGATCQGSASVNVVANQVSEVMTTLGCP